jgi:hypothetical protein
LSDPAHDRRQRLIGIALMCGALACFAVLDAMAKFLNGYMDTLQVVPGPSSWRSSSPIRSRDPR